MKYFAYGMNTNTKEMKLRCPRAHSLGPAWLPNHEFRFALHADILPTPGFVTHGVLWEISEDCLIQLDKLEGWPTYYEKKTVLVQHELQKVEAVTYYMVGHLPDDYPGADYLEMVRQGYFEHRVPEKQIDQALEFIGAYQSALAKKGQYIYG